MSTKKQPKTLDIVDFQNKLTTLVQDIVRAEIKQVLETQLDNIVAGELAKIRLLKPGTSDLSTMIEKKIKATVNGLMTKETVMVLARREIAEKTSAQISKMQKDLTTMIASRVVGK